MYSFQQLWFRVSNNLFSFFSHPKAIMNPISTSTAPANAAFLSKYSRGDLIFSPCVFQQHLSTQVIGRYFQYLSVTDSTMEIASNAIKNGHPSGTLILAEEQTAGRGREGREWKSQPKGNLYFTIILSCTCFEDAFSINLAIPTAIVQSCKELGINNSAIKWPNDVWIDNKKISGFLLDTSYMAPYFNCSAGIGINVNQNMSDVKEILGNSTCSLSNILGKSIEREVFLASVCNHLENILAMNYNDIVKLYSENILFKPGDEIIVMPKKFEDKSAWYKATFVSINTKDQSQLGQLIIKKEDGSIHNLVSEEISVRPYIDSFNDKNS